MVDICFVTGIDVPAPALNNLRGCQLFRVSIGLVIRAVGSVYTLQSPSSFHLKGFYYSLIWSDEYVRLLLELSSDIIHHRCDSSSNCCLWWSR